VDYRGVTEGIVRDHAGKPVAGATVVVRTPHVTVSAVTDAEGRYRIDGLSLGKGRIEILARNHVDVSARDLRIDSVAGAPLEFELHEGRTLVGRVLDGRGGGVAGIRVRVAGDSIKESVTAGAGDYRIAGLEPGYVTLIAGAAAYPEVEVPVLIPAGSGQTSRDITVHRGASVAGRVADDAGRPVAGAMVNVLGRMEDWVLSGDEGEFTLHGVPPGDPRVTATHDDYFTASSDGLRIRPGEVLRGLELVMARGGRVRGHVLTPEEKPAAGVRVGLEVIEAEGSTGDVLDPTTDAQGAFQISRIPPGRYRVVVRGGAKSSAQEVELGAGAVVEDVLLVLAATARIQGRVEDASGAPVRGAIVEALATGAANGSPQASAVTEEDGGFSLSGLPAGGYLVRSRLPVGGPSVRSEEVAAGESDLVFRLPMPGAIAGTVADTEGKPVTSFELRITPQEGEVVRLPVGNVAGAFRVDGVAPGRYEVLARTAAGGSAAPSPVLVEPGAETGGLQLRVTAGETIWGTVLFNGGAPAPDVVVVARPDASLKNGPERRTTTNADGSFSVEGLVAGTYRLALSYEGLAEFSEDIRVPNHTGVTLALPRVTTLTIRATDPAGRPVTGARVQVDNKNGTVPVRPAASADQFPPDQRAAKEAELIARARVTDASGVCARGGVPEGTVTVTVSADGYRVAIADTEVKPTGLSEVSIVLTPTQP